MCLALWALSCSCGRYATRWHGVFVEPRHEEAYMARHWAQGTFVRRVTIACLTIAILRNMQNVMQSWILDRGDNEPFPEYAVPVFCVAGVGILLQLLGWKPNQWVQDHWTPIVVVSISFELFALVIAYVSACKRCAAVWLCGCDCGYGCGCGSRCDCGSRSLAAVCGVGGVLQLAHRTVRPRDS